LLAVDDQPVIHGSVGADHHVVGTDHVAFARRNARRLAIDDFLGVNPRIDFSSIAENCACQTFQVLERMKRCLAGEAKRRTAVPETERNAIDQLGIVDSGAMRCLELPLEVLSLTVAAEKEVAFDTLKIAVDVLHGGDRLDAMDRRHVTLGRESGAFLAMEPGNVVVAVVQSRREMSGSATGFAAPDRSIIYEHNRATSACKQVRRGHSGDSSANHADIRAEILIERLELRNFGVGHPDGGRMT